MSIKKQYIPAPLASAVKNGYVTDASEILDKNKGKRQDVINQETDNEISGIKGGSTKSIAELSEDIANEAERASGVEAGLRESIDELGQIGLDPDNAISTNGDDFDGDTTAKRSKIPTIGAIIDGNPSVYDVSKRNPTGGPNSDGKFTLEYILTNADTLIPTSRRHGGMEICFVQSSDNTNVQFINTSPEWTTNVIYWQKTGEKSITEQFNEKGKIDLPFTKTANSVNIPLPIYLTAGHYVLIVTTEETGTLSANIKDSELNTLTNFTKDNNLKEFQIQNSGIIYIYFGSSSTISTINICIEKNDEGIHKDTYYTEGRLSYNTSSNKWGQDLTKNHIQIPVDTGDEIEIVNSSVAISGVFLTQLVKSPISNTSPSYVPDSIFSVTANEKKFIDVPDGGKCLVLNIGTNGESMPLDVKINGVSIFDVTGSLISSQQETFDIPKYWNTKVNECIASVRENNLKSGQHGDSFVFVTDSHFPDNAGMSVLLAKKVSELTNNKLFVHGGDFITREIPKLTYLQYLYAYMKDIDNCYGDNYRILYGNHDYNVQQDDTVETEHLSDAEFYAVMMKNFEKNVINPNRNLYYYWDNVNQNIRYVCFNFRKGGNITAQLPWFVELLTNAPANCHICVINHGMWASPNDTEFIASEKIMADICDALNQKVTYTNGDINVDFTNATQKVMCILCGHIHTDKQVYYGDSNIPVIACKCDQIVSSELGTDDEQRINFVDIDITGGKIYLVRLGFVEESSTRIRVYDIVA